VIYVDVEQCTGCGLCVEVCPNGAINLVDGVARVEQSLCQECEVCLSTCPVNAILALQEPAGAERPVPVRVSVSTPTPTWPVAPAPQPGGGVRPWLGAALAFLGQEVVPRAAALLRTHGQRSSPAVAPYRIASAPGRRNYGRRGRGRRTRHRRGRW